MGERFLIIIPAYNEEENIGKVLQGIQQLRLPVDILVVNDGSWDNTALAASSYGVAVVSHPYNLGYGAALQTGYKYAMAKGYPFVMQFDGDGQHNPTDLPLLMQELKKGDVDIVIGSRYMEGATTFKSGAVKKLGVHFFRWLIRSLTKVKISDPTSGLRGVSSKVFHFYAIRDRFPADFPDADILIQQILREYRVREVPAHMRIREAGVSMHAGIKPLFYMMKVLLSVLIVMIQYKLTKKVV
ncbi:MAG: glycosyltransferase family 2 protein [Tumebacillaceae bacterium]